MNMSLDLASLSLGFVVGSFVAWALLRHRSHQSQSDSREVETLKEQLADAKRHNERQLEEVRNEISVVAYPYNTESGDDGWIVDDRKAEVGYQFQLFIRGIPCFEPHKVAVQSFEKKEVKTDKIKNAAEDVMHLLQSWATQHPAIKVAETFKQVGRRSTERQRAAESAVA